MNAPFCEYTEEIVCPWCGFTYGDSWECCPERDCFEMDCQECGKPFAVARMVSVDYTTTKKEG